MRSHRSVGAINDRTANPRIHLWAAGFDRPWRRRHWPRRLPRRGHDPVSGTRHQRDGRHRRNTAGAGRRTDETDDPTEIVVTAQKREENLQDVPISVQAIGTRRLDQLNISNFEDYTKQLPSVCFQTSQPGVTIVYMRGVATRRATATTPVRCRRSAPISTSSRSRRSAARSTSTSTTSRASRASPGRRARSTAPRARPARSASSPTSPSMDVRRARRRGAEHGRAWRHGRQARGHDQRADQRPTSRSAASPSTSSDAGFIDNVLGSRTYCDDQRGRCNVAPRRLTVDNGGLRRRTISTTSKTYGGRAALKIDLDDNWTVTPTIMHQKRRPTASSIYDPELGDLNVERFRDERRKDKFTQAALTIEGKIANFDVTYAGAYMDRPTFRSTTIPITPTPMMPALRVLRRARRYFYFNDAAGNHARPAAVHRGHGPFQEDEPGASHRVSAEQPLPGDRRRILSAADQFHPPGLSASTS